MENPPKFRCLDGAVKAAQGQVQRGNTRRQHGRNKPGVLFMTDEAL
jgi:hypothetical protein